MRSRYEVQQLTRSALVRSAKLGEAYVDGKRRWLMVTGGAVRSQFEDHEASRQACLHGKVAGGLAELQGFSVWLDDASINGDEQDRRARVSVCDEFERRKKETELIRRPGVLIGLRGLPRHALEHGGVDSERGKEGTASCWSACGRKGMRMTSSTIF
jgi:hypothetical protein